MNSPGWRIGDDSKVVKMPLMESRLKKLRRSKKKPLRYVAEIANTSIEQVRRLENGDRRMTAHWARRLAPAYGLRPGQIIDELEGTRTVPVVGKVGAGAKIYPINDYAIGEGMDEALCPDGLDPEKTVAVVVEGDSMLPIGDGWLLFYSRPSVTAADIVGHLCVVKLADDGPTLVKMVRRGYQRGRFNLLSTNAGPLDDQKLDWAARVLVQLAPELAYIQPRDPEDGDDREAA